MGSPKPYRPAADQRPAPPPPLPGTPDAIDTLASQVRIDTNRNDLPVHRLAADWTMEGLGVHYATVCGKILAGVEGAILTTREATCERCLRGGA